MNEKQADGGEVATYKKHLKQLVKQYKAAGNKPVSKSLKSFIKSLYPKNG